MPRTNEVYHKDLVTQSIPMSYKDVSSKNWNTIEQPPATKTEYNAEIEYLYDELLQQFTDKIDTFLPFMQPGNKRVQSNSTMVDNDFDPQELLNITLGIVYRHACIMNMNTLHNILPLIGNEYRKRRNNCNFNTMYATKLGMECVNILEVNKLLTVKKDYNHFYKKMTYFVVDIEVDLLKYLFQLHPDDISGILPSFVCHNDWHSIVQNMSYTTLEGNKYTGEVKAIKKAK